MKNNLFFFYWTVSNGVSTFIFDPVVVEVVFFDCSSCPHISSNCLFCIRITTATDVHGKIPNSVITALINVGGVTSYVILRILRFEFGVSVDDGDRADCRSGWSTVKSFGSPRLSNPKIKRI